MYVEIAICLQLPFIVKCKLPVGLLHYKQELLSEHCRQGYWFAHDAIRFLLTQRIQQEQTIQKYIIFQVQTSDLMSLQKPFSFFFKKKFGGHQSFLWGHWYPCFGLLVTSWLGFKARVGPLACMLCCLCFMDSSDSPLVNTCWLLGNQHDSWAIFNPSPQYLYMWQCDQRQMESLATLKTRTKACS